MEDNTGKRQFDFSQILYGDVKDLVDERIETAKYTGNASILVGMEFIVGLPDDMKRGIRTLLTADFMIRNIGQLDRFFSDEAKEERQEILDAMKILGANMSEKTFLAAKQMLVDKGDSSGLSILYYITEKMAWNGGQPKQSAEDAMLELAYSCIKKGGKNHVETVIELFSNEHLDVKIKKSIRDDVIANSGFYWKLFGSVRIEGVGVTAKFPLYLFNDKRGKMVRPAQPGNQPNGRKNKI